jgi:DNA-binding transcriptional regulator of glucitol operon
MVRRFRFALAPRWIALHALVLGACVVMVLLGRWQWHVAHVHHGDIRNYAYAFQWWAFAGFALFMWLRALRDRAAHFSPEVPAEAQPPVAYRRYVMPQQPPEMEADSADAERARYNAYLRELAQAAELAERRGEQA